ncbi:MAG: hypothetical protein HZA37_01935 [Parcubacteria group bacterium]|nr:hypothetical protein [Parcubacteria group bacterium]
MTSARFKNITSFRSERGALAIQVLIFSGITIILLSGFVVLMDIHLKLLRRDADNAAAFAIAEAGIEYYRWHLAHAPADYQDGTGQSGPYVHDYRDKDGNLIGQFSLNITPPPVGSTVVVIQSTGKLSGNQEIEKIIKVKMGIPSFAKYAAALNANVRFGEGTEVFGEIHSNGGVRFDGLAHNIVSSALISYDDPDHDGANEFGVHTHLSPTDPLPPASVPVRTDVFEAGRQFPVPALDFAGITQTLSTIKADAQSGGFYAASSGSGYYGYDVVLKTNDTFDLYKISRLYSPTSGCSNSNNQDGWGLWSIRTESLVGNYPIPANGLIFLEDNAWVRGQIDGARVTIASARFPDNPATRSSITVNADLLYSNYNGSDVIALIAQKDINIGFRSDTDLRVDAALVAQNGRVGRFYYSSSCTTYYTRNSIVSYGIIVSNQRYGFAYTDGTGYQTRSLIYDSNLLYNPPPSFPLASDSYGNLSWEEIK